jgi:hypothetical protein
MHVTEDNKIMKVVIRCSKFVFALRITSQLTKIFVINSVLHIRDISGSSLVPKSGYPGCDFLWVFTVSPGEFWGSTLKYTTTSYCPNYGMAGFPDKLYVNFSFHII